jgi:hypothetical protein
MSEGFYMRFWIEFWWAVHNIVAHPLMSFSFNSKWSNRFHDWTAEKAERAELLMYARKELERLTGVVLKAHASVPKVERIFLTDFAEQLLGPWYESYDDQPEMIPKINKLVEETCAAWKEFMRSGTKPDTSKWHDNQCMLFGMLVEEMSPLDVSRN